MKRAIFVGMLLVVSPVSVGGGRVSVAMAEEDVGKVVEALISAIGTSGLKFFRNGQEQSAEAAAMHVRQKYEYYKSKIRTPEEFIEKAASKSMMTGQPYLVRVGDKDVPVSEWLLGVLQEYRAAHPG